MELTETETEILAGFIAQWLEEKGDNYTGDLEAIYYKLTGDQKPCIHCGEKLDKDIWKEELGMCVECSNAYYTHEEDEEDN